LTAAAVPAAAATTPLVASAPPCLALVRTMSLPARTLAVSLCRPLSLGMAALSMRTRRLFFLAATALARMFVAAPLPAARKSLHACNVIGHGGNIRRMDIRGLAGLAIELFKQFLQFGKGLGAGRAGTAFFFPFLPVHFDECDRINYFVTDFTAGHSISFHRALKRSFTSIHA
jgi:hypothetical protein